MDVLKPILHPPSPLNWEYLDPTQTWNKFETLCRSNPDGRLLKTLYLLLHRKLWTSERKTSIFRPPPDPFPFPLCPHLVEPKTMDHLPVCTTSITILRLASNDDTHHNPITSLMASITRKNISYTTRLILEIIRWTWGKRSRILYDNPPTTRPSEEEIAALAETLRLRFPT